MTGGIFGFKYDYEESARGRLLVVGADEIAVDRLAESGVRMLTDHEILGILPLEVEYTNFKAKLSYLVKGKKPLAEVLKGRKLSLNEYVKIISQIISAVNESPRYFLNESNFVLSLDYIFSTNDYSLDLVYLPVNDLPSKDSVFNVIRNNIVTVLYAQIRDQDVVAAKPILEDFLSLEYSLVEITDRLNKMVGKGPEVANRRVETNRPLDQGISSRPQGQSPEVNFGSNQQQAKQSQPSLGAKGESSKPNKSQDKKSDKELGVTSFSRLSKIALIAVSSILVILAWVAFVFLGKGKHQEGFMYIAIGITLLGADGIFAAFKLIKPSQLVVGMAEASSAKEQGAAAKEVKKAAEKRTPASFAPYTKPVSNNTVPLSNPTVFLSEAYLVVENGEQHEKVRLSNLPLIIGRGKTYGTYTLSDQAISSSHASFENNNGQYVITDLSSTNGTKINGTRLVANKPYPINDGDIIQLGRINFAFRFEI
ncbi:MAG: hypothetical protein APF81_16660 [Desulfosporosinus sp. BRH_c37]|nr:MAG: hypothetical protein APF81_16660 [Desulfosporosinus sp. BRH_c37]